MSQCRVRYKPMEEMQDALAKNFKEGQRFIARELTLYVPYRANMIGRYLGHMTCVETVDFTLTSSHAVTKVYELKTKERIGKGWTND